METDSCFFQRQLNHIVCWTISGIFWSHKPQNKCKENNRIKQEKCDFLKEILSGLFYSIQVHLFTLLIISFTLLIISVFHLFFCISYNALLLLLLFLFFFFNYPFNWLRCVVKSHSWLHFSHNPWEVGIVKMWQIFHCCVHRKSSKSLKILNQ